ncbi:MAG: isoprenylcysteine carboxylmethyltransferase family protein [Promethearchaeota archaeon]|nr:MAG: isoprenylcysteine carboxylmethyltransferase family protein [Candidatus Lokiarchaeota archaeon]
MEIKNTSAHEREVSHSHLIQGLSPVIFLIIWILDSNVFFVSIYLNYIIPYLLRLTAFLFTLILALLLIYFSHRILFNKNIPSNILITDGILKHVRNPLYLGVLLIYLAFLFYSISLISVAVFIVIFLIYNRMVNYEENMLEKLFGEDYLKYKKRVSKWIPNPFKKSN